MTPKLKLILRMVKLGCAVFPVVPNGKIPAIKNWVNAASKDLEVIREYFLANPSHIFVVDPDGLEGVQNSQRLEKKYGRCPPTITVRTPHGLRLHFRAPKHRVRNSTSRIAQRVDVRGDGGYVVAPGSKTLDGVYRFAAGRGPNEVEIAPAWLLKMLAPRAGETGQLPQRHREHALKYAGVTRQRELDRLMIAPRLRLAAVS